MNRTRGRITFQTTLPVAAAAVALTTWWPGCGSSQSPDRAGRAGRAARTSGADIWLATSVQLQRNDNRNRILDWVPGRGVMLGIITRRGRLDSGDPGAMMVVRLPGPGGPSGSSGTPIPLFARDALFGPGDTMFYLDQNERLWHAGRTTRAAVTRPADRARRTLVDDRVWPGASLSADGRRLVYVREPRSFVTQIRVLDLRTSHRQTVVAGPGVNDRPALTAGGETVVFVSGKTGVASLWSVPAAGGTARQLTNVGLRLKRGRAPEGFVPVPSGVRPLKCGERSCYFAAQEVVWKVDLGGGQARSLGNAERVLGLCNGRLFVRSAAALESVPVGVGP